MSRWLPWSESTISLTGDAMLYIVSTCSGFAYSGARVALSSRAEDILGKEQGKMFSVFKGFSAFLYFAAYTCAMAHEWRSENSFQELVLPFHHVGSRDQIQVSMLVSSRCSYQGSHLSGPVLIISIHHCLKPQRQKKMFFAASVLSVANPQLPPGYLLLPRQSFERVLAELSGNPFLNTVILHGAWPSGNRQVSWPSL